VLLLLARPWLPLDLPDPAHEPAQARDAADEILSRPRYDWRDEPTLLERVGDWIARQLSRLVAPLGIGGVPVWVGWLVLFLLVGVVAWLVYRSRAGWALGARPREAGDGSRVVVAAGEDDVDWPAEVSRAEAEGRWRDALRARYRVLVGELAAREVITDLVGRTAGELVADVRRTAPAAGGDFAAATDVFEAVWYGGDPAGPEVRDRFVALADRALGRTSPARLR
jgi:Domain of unknown function (DUF4129)